MGQKRRSDDSLVSQPPQSSKVLAAPAGAVDPTLASLFASSVGYSFVLPHVPQKTDTSMSRQGR